VGPPAGKAEMDALADLTDERSLGGDTRSSERKPSGRFAQHGSCSGLIDDGPADVSYWFPSRRLGSLSAPAVYAGRCRAAFQRPCPPSEPRRKTPSTAPHDPADRGQRSCGRSPSAILLKRQTSALHIAHHSRQPAPLGLAGGLRGSSNAGGDCHNRSRSLRRISTGRMRSGKSEGSGGGSKYGLR
jgi:hypothetical protein